MQVDVLTDAISLSSSSIVDGNWHFVEAVKGETTMDVLIDGVLAAQAEIRGPFVQVDTDGDVFVGGLPADEGIIGITERGSLRGCMREVSLNSVSLDSPNIIDKGGLRLGLC